MTEIHFKHTQFKTDCIVYKEQVFAVIFAPMQKSVVILGPGGSALPVEGSIDEVRNKIKAATNADVNTGEQVNGITTT